MDWDISWKHPDPGGAADPDPNTTEPSSGEFFNTGDQYHPGAGVQLYVLVHGGTSATMTIWIWSKQLDDWIVIRASAAFSAGTPVFVDVPPNAKIHLQKTAQVGPPTAIVAGVIPR